MTRAVAERGSVTAETAMLLPVLAAVLVLSLWAVAAAGAQVRCVDAARTGARALARDEPPALVTAAVRRAAPAGAVVKLTRDGNLAVVEVHVQARLPVPWRGRAPAIVVGSRGVAAVER